MTSVSSQPQTRLEYPQQENCDVEEVYRVLMIAQNILSSSWYFYFILFQTLPHGGTFK